jgi:hypothetical protein
MNQHKTESILQRVPKILAVTAASYGLSLDARERPQAHGSRKDGHGSRASQGGRREHRH